MQAKGKSQKDDSFLSLSVEPPVGLGFTYWVGGGGRATKVPLLISRAPCRVLALGSASPSGTFSSLLVYMSVCSPACLLSVRRVCIGWRPSVRGTGRSHLGIDQIQSINSINNSSVGFTCVLGFWFLALAPRPRLFMASGSFLALVPRTSG